MNSRIKQLDSIRGLAALAVVLSHIPFAAMSLSSVVYQLLVWLRINNGHSSVMLFFVLSGFVLSIPFLERKGNGYFPYLVKRFCRIYFPYIVSITFAIVLSQILWSKKVEVIGDWELLWNTPINLKLIVEHIILVGNIPSNTFNGPIWSLIHELRISLIFPLLVLLIKRFNWKINIIICLVLSSISGLNNILKFQESIGYNTTYFHSMHFAAFFLLGALLAKHRKDIVAKYRQKHISFKWLLLLFSLFFYQFSEFIVYYLHEITNLQVVSTHFWILVEYGVALGSIGLIVSAISSLRVERLLLFKPILFLGNISYSLYLYHLPVLLGCIYMLQNVFSLWVISLIALFLSICISAVAWLLVEKSSIKVGRSLAKKVSNKQLILKSKMNRTA